MKRDIEENLLEVVDENENIIGIYQRNIIHREGLLHREINIWIYTNEKEIIFQKRARTKELYPDLFDASAGGHIEIGQSPIEAAISELEEETGIKETENSLKLIKKEFDNLLDDITNMKNNVIKYIYSYKFEGNINELRIEEGKGAGFEKFSLEDLKNLSDEEKKRFIPRFLQEDYLDVYRDILTGK